MTTKIISGNFNIEIEGEFDETKTVGEGENAMSVAQARDESAVAYIGQRDVLSAVYKSLLKEGQKRNELPFSNETAQQIESKVETQFAPYGTFTASVSEHVPGETVSSRSQATAMWAQIQASPSKFVPAMLGLTDFNVTDEVGIEACHTFLAGFRKPVERKAKAA